MALATSGGFAEKEAAGLATLVRLTADALAIATKRFDAETGAALTEEVRGDTITAHRTRLAELQAQAAEEEAFIAKAEKLTPQNKGGKP